MRNVAVLVQFAIIEDSESGYGLREIFQTQYSSRTLPQLYQKNSSFVRKNTVIFIICVVFAGEK
jgi:hypothetical protein